MILDTLNREDLKKARKILSFCLNDGKISDSDLSYITAVFLSMSVKNSIATFNLPYEDIKKLDECIPIALKVVRNETTR